jgi:hypothetical protein
VKSLFTFFKLRTCESILRFYSYDGPTKFANTKRGYSSHLELKTSYKYGSHLELKTSYTSSSLLKRRRSGSFGWRIKTKSWQIEGAQSAYTTVKEDLVGKDRK